MMTGARMQTGLVCSVYRLRCRQRHSGAAESRVVWEEQREQQRRGFRICEVQRGNVGGAAAAVSEAAVVGFRDGRCSVTFRRLTKRSLWPSVSCARATPS